MTRIVPTCARVVHDSLITRQIKRIRWLTIEEGIRVTRHGHCRSHRIGLRIRVRNGHDAGTASLSSPLDIAPVFHRRRVRICGDDHYLRDAFQPVWVKIVDRLIPNV